MSDNIIPYGLDKIDVTGWNEDQADATIAQLQTTLAKLSAQAVKQSNDPDTIKLIASLTTALDKLARLRLEMNEKLAEQREMEAEQRQQDWATYLTTDELRTVMGWVTKRMMGAEDAEAHTEAEA